MNVGDLFVLFLVRDLFELVGLFFLLLLVFGLYILILAASLLFVAAVVIGLVSAVVHDRDRPESFRDRAFWLSRGVAYLSFAAALFSFGFSFLFGPPSDGGLLVFGMVVMVVMVVMVLWVRVAYWLYRRQASEEEEDPPEPVPESDPQPIDPAGNLADAVESGDLDALDDVRAEDLREFVDAAEAGELGPVDPGLEAQVRLARALLEDPEGGDYE